VYSLPFYKTTTLRNYYHKIIFNYFTRKVCENRAIESPHIPPEIKHAYVT